MPPATSSATPAATAPTVSVWVPTTCRVRTIGIAYATTPATITSANAASRSVTPAGESGNGSENTSGPAAIVSESPSTIVSDAPTASSRPKP